MIDSALEKLADSVREVMHPGLPVDPLKIASEEGILLGAGRFGETFSGRIEFHPKKGKFVLFYPQSGNPNRNRFSIAHELGHYYIDEHRTVLSAGGSHNSSAGFVCDDRFEREADLFAAALLIPRKYIESQTHVRGFMTLSGILRMATDCKTSVTCAAIRYAQYASEACAVVLSSGGKVLYGITSDEMGAIGLKIIKKGTPVPPTSPTAKCMASPGVENIVEGRSQAAGWFANRFKNLDLWEEAIPLGYFGQALTLLAEIAETHDSDKRGE